MAGREVSVKKYVVKLSEGERQHLNELIGKGKSPAKRLLKARILGSSTFQVEAKRSPSGAAMR